MAEHCKSDFFIFCENDWHLIENKTVNTKILIDSLEILKCNIM